MHRDAGGWRHGGGIALLPFKREQRRRRCVFIRVSLVISWFIKIDLKQFIAAIQAPRKFRIIFYNFCYYFWGQRCWWTETSITSNDFLFFMFPLPSALLLLPLPLLRRPWICMLCQQTSPKRWFANVNNMTSYCAQYWNLEGGHPIKQWPRASPDLWTPLDCKDILRDHNCFIWILRRL